jgi:hypothetical protein
MLRHTGPHMPVSDVTAYVMNVSGGGKVLCSVCSVIPFVNRVMAFPHSTRLPRKSFELLQ